MEVTRLNNSPRNIAAFFLDCVTERRGCPLLTRTDCGTENGILAALQCYFCNDNYPLNGENAHRYGASTSNQRIENWWSHFHRTCSNWWIHFFKDMLDADILDLNNELHICGFVSMEYYRMHLMKLRNTGIHITFGFHVMRLLVEFQTFYTSCLRDLVLFTV
jgi:hypothetical protein